MFALTSAPMSDPERATVFGQVAEQYERARPSYPEALIDDVVELAGGGRIVEIGAGTGKATRLLAPQVAELVAIEPDPAMAAVLARTGAGWPQLRIETTTFEEWEAPDGAYDVVTSAQAWHWVDPAVAIPKVVTLLRPGGCLAPFWNRPLYDQEQLRAELDAAYAQFAPEMDDSVSSGTKKDLADRVGVDVHVERLRESEAFARVDVRTYDWSDTRTAAEYVDLLGTHSNHLMLPPERRTPLHGAIASAIEAAGGTITSPQRTYLIIAR